jgi:hypothetical protein
MILSDYLNIGVISFALLAMIYFIKLYLLTRSKNMLIIIFSLIYFVSVRTAASFIPFNLTDWVFPYWVIFVFGVRGIYKTFKDFSAFKATSKRAEEEAVKLIEVAAEKAVSLIGDNEAVAKHLLETATKVAKKLTIEEKKGRNKNV